MPHTPSDSTWKLKFIIDSSRDFFLTFWVQIWNFSVVDGVKNVCDREVEIEWIEFG